MEALASSSSSHRLQLVSWKWRKNLCLTLGTVILILDAIAVSRGFSLQTLVEDMTLLDNIVLMVNFPGLATLLLFGQPLTDPADIAWKNWNLACFLLGGFIVWFLGLMFIGFILDGRWHA